MLLPVTPLLGVAVGALVVVAAGVAALGRLGYGPAVLRAALRAAAQLAAVSLLIATILGSTPLIAVFVLVMFVVAGGTAGRRITAGRAAWWALVPVGASALPMIAVLLATGILPPRGLAVIPVAGILIGGALTAVTLSGRRAVDELTHRRGEVEAAMAVGLSDRDAAIEICRPHAATALVPALDQTRTTGLVTLPGAFVGMLLGGATVVTAGVVQLFVLIALLAVEAIAVVITIELAARGAFGVPIRGRASGARPQAGPRRHA